MICRFWNHRNPVLVVVVLRLRYTFRWVEHNSPHSPFSSSYSTFFPPNDENHGWYDFLNHQNSLWTIFPERRRRVTSSRLDYENIHMSWCNWINFLKSVWWLFPKVLPILALKLWYHPLLFHIQYQFFDSSNCSNNELFYGIQIILLCHVTNGKLEIQNPCLFLPRMQTCNRDFSEICCWLQNF